MTIAYRLLLRFFPALDYSSHCGRTWGGFFRFDIHDETDAALYLRRFVLWRTPYGSVYLHRIVRSDRDRCLHDHPWNSLLITLWGGYREVLENGDAFRRPGCVRFMPAKTRHRVLLWHRVSDGGEVPAWTLCCVGRKVRSWGFWRRGEFIPWREFLAGDREC